MGCSGSLPVDESHDGRLPVKPHLRQTFGQARLRPGGEDDQGETSAPAQRPGPPQHDVVLLHSCTGTAYAAMLAQTLASHAGLSLCLLSDLGKSTTSFARPSVLAATTSEILPVKQDGGLVAARPSTIAATYLPEQLTLAQLGHAVSHSALGVILVVSAGSTWDDGVLSWLRHPTVKERPLVLLHVPESCPAPGAADWPGDVQANLNTRAIPTLTFISSYAAHGVERALAALRKQAGGDASRGDAHGSSPRASHTALPAPQIKPGQPAIPITAGVPNGISGRSGSGEGLGRCGSGSGSSLDPERSSSPEALMQRASNDSKALGSPTMDGGVGGSSATLTVGSSSAQGARSTPVTISPPGARTPELDSGGEQQQGAGHVHPSPPPQLPTVTATAWAPPNPWAAMQEQLAQRLVTLQRAQHAPEASSGTGAAAGASPSQLAKKAPAGRKSGRAGGKNGKRGGDAHSAAAPPPPSYDIVLGLHHRAMCEPVDAIARALAPYFSVLVVDGVGAMAGNKDRHARRPGLDLSVGLPPAPPPPPAAPLTGRGSLTGGTPSTVSPADVTAALLLGDDEFDDAPANGMGGLLSSAPGLTAAWPLGRHPRGASFHGGEARGGMNGGTLLPGGAAFPPLHLPSTFATTLAASLVEGGAVAAPGGGLGKAHSARHSRSISLGAGSHLGLALLQHTGFPGGLPCRSSSCSHGGGGGPHGYAVVSSVSGAARTTLAAGAARHYVLFPGYNLVTAGPLAMSEVQLALQGGACLHVVCEASFNLVRPAAAQWLQLGGAWHAGRLEAAWDDRMLYYPDHMDPFLAELAARLVSLEERAGQKPPASAAPILGAQAGGVAPAVVDDAQAQQPGSPRSAELAGAKGIPIPIPVRSARQQDARPPTTGGGASVGARPSSLPRAFSDVSALPGVADLMRLATSPHDKAVAARS